jgi:hypothetical protein
MIKKIFIIGAIFLIGIVLFGFQKSNDQQLICRRLFLVC